MTFRHEDDRRCACMSPTCRVYWLELSLADALENPRKGSRWPPNRIAGALKKARFACQHRAAANRMAA